MKLAAAILASVLFAFDAQAQCTGCFHPSFGPAGRAYPTGFMDHFVVADFDRDGFPDIVAIDGLGIQLLKGSGTGSFGAPVHFDGSAPTQIATADFNGDGLPDVATAGDKISIYLGNGDGTFQPPIEADSGIQANGFAVADFNHDGNPDLAVNSAIDGVRVYFGNGDGTVGPALLLGSSFTGFLVAGDFNGDGLPDIAAAGSLEMDVFLSDGHGGFSAAIVSGVSGARMAVGDFNRDGIDDLAVTVGLGILIELGNGDGTFTPGNAYPTANGAFAVAVGDFTLDGLLDLAVTESAGAVVILDGHGDGTFESGNTIPAAGDLGELAVGDFDANGRLDVAVVDESDRYVNVHLADAAGNFPQSPTYPTGGTTDPSQPPAVALGDFTGSGHLDMAVANIVSQTVGILPGDGMGGFAAPLSVPLPSPPRWLAAGSFHAGHTDLAVATDNGIQVILSNGDGTFQVLPSFGTLTAYVAAADFDGDGNIDLAWIGNQLNISLGNGDGTFTDGPPIAGAPTGDAVAVGFFNADDNLDLVLTSRGVVSVLVGDGAGGFTQTFTYSFPTEAFSKVAAADFDGDGKTDVVVAHLSGDELLNVEVYWGNGDGTLQTPPDQFTGGIVPFDVHAIDVNGDGLPDVVIHDSAAFTILASHGDRTFESSTWISPLFSGFSEPGDLDGDGKPDLAYAGGFPVAASVLFNTICVPSKLVMSVEPSSCNASGVPFATPPTVSVVDGGDNLMTCDDGTVVRAAIQPGTGAPGAHLGGQTIVPTGAGTVTFSNLSIDRPGRGYVLTFTHPAVGTTVSRTLSQDLTAVLSGPATICNLGEGTYRTAGGYDRYQWLLDGAPLSRADTVTLSGIATGPHTLDVTVFEDDCTASDEATITVLESPPQPSIVAPPSVRVGATGIVASATGGANSYAWSITGGTITGGQGTSQITFDAGAPGTTITLRVIASAGSGCTAPEAFGLVQVDFADAGSGPFREDIDTVARNGITAGCAPGLYCPDAPVSRAQMAVFLLKAEHGPYFVPPPCAGIFVDVECEPDPAFAVDWIEQLHLEGITAGCDATHYCPDDPVTRAQMAVFLLKTEHGATFVPPPCVGIFEDVECEPNPAFAVDWIETLSAEGVTAGCSVVPALYCPDAVVSRAQMATFLVRTLNLR